MMWIPWVQQTSTGFCLNPLLLNRIITCQVRLLDGFNWFHLEKMVTSWRIFFQLGRLNHQVTLRVVHRGITNKLWESKLKDNWAWGPQSAWEMPRTKRDCHMEIDSWPEFSVCCKVSHEHHFLLGISWAIMNQCTIPRRVCFILLRPGFCWLYSHVVFTLEGTSNKGGSAKIRQDGLFQHRRLEVRTYSSH